MTVVARHPSIITAAVAPALRCLPLLLVISFGTGGPVLAQERGALWTGTVRWTAKHTPTHLVTSTATVRLRETRVSTGQIELIHEGSAVSVTHSTLGEDCIFSGQGTSPAEGHAGHMEREQSVGRNGELRWGAWTYKLRIKPDREPIWTQTCPSVDGPSTHTFGGNAGSSWQTAIGEAGLDPGAPRVLDGGRMTGSYTTQGKDSWEDTASWNICREGVSCPPQSQTAGTPPPNLCPDPRNQTALLQLGLDQQRLLKDRLDAQRRAYDALARQAVQWKNDFTHASRDCSLWSAALTLSGFLAGRGPTSTGARGRASNPGEAFNNFLNLVDKVAVGDPSWMLPNVESDTLPSAETLWDAFRAGYDALGPASPDKMLNDLRTCGAPTTGGVMDGAVTYVRLLQQIEPMMQDIRKTLNDLRSKDNELLNLWSDYRRACLEYAKCEKLPASMCAAVPSAR